MTNANKQEYRQFCEQTPDMPVFLQPWWLDAVYCEDWDALLYKEKDNILAAMPYGRHKKIWIYHNFAAKAHSHDGTVDCISRKSEKAEPLRLGN